LSVALEAQAGTKPCLGSGVCSFPQTLNVQNSSTLEIALITERVVHAMKAAVCKTTLLHAVASVLVVGLPTQLALGASCTSKHNKDIVIILDVGHTPSEPGATSARGVPEYDFNLHLGLRIKSEMVLAGFQSTHVMLTEASGEAGLNQRADRANDLNADLFLSIHHDSVRDEYLVPWTYQNEEHYYYDNAKGFSLHVSSENPQFEDSYRWARILADQLLTSGLVSNPIHASNNPIGARVPLLDLRRGIYRRDLLVVLSRTEMPAVLLEAGVIVNRDEELAVQTASFEKTVATAVTHSIEMLCNLAGVTTLYKVTNVAADDVLNIRSGPNADLTIVGTIPPDGRGVRIIGACTGQWCQVDYSGTQGWVNRHFLTSE
jgi:N-acetylmuramoyl-L-alanine amidase